MSTATVAPVLMTAEEFVRRYGGTPTGPSDLPTLHVGVIPRTRDRVGVYSKVGEWLKAGVAVVVYFDPDSIAVCVYRPTVAPRIFAQTDIFTLPDVLPGFAVPVRRFFE